MSVGSLRPVADGERTELIDVLRGFALFGILLVNFWGGIGTWIPRLDQAFDAIIEYAFAGSFYPLFSLLFGLGFGIQLLRARQRGTGAALLYLRRMLVLFLIGTVHAVLIWSGDILVTYAMLGLLLVPLGRLPDRALLGFIIILAILQIGQERVRSGIRQLSGTDEYTQDLRSGASNEARAIATNLRRRADDGEQSYTSAVHIQWVAYARDVEFYTRWDRIVFSEILLLFLLGMYVGRKRLLENADRHRRGLLLVAVTATAALALGLAYEHLELEWAAEFGMLSWLGTDMGPTFLYLSGIALLYSLLPRAARLLRSLAWAGRMGLTNYLMQSVVMTFLFVPYGAGIKPLNTTFQVIFCIAFFFGFQIPASRWWLSRYQYGPAEWVWRSLTYGARQPMRRQGLPAPAPAPAVTAPA